MKEWKVYMNGDKQAWIGHQANEENTLDFIEELLFILFGLWPNDGPKWTERLCQLNGCYYSLFYNDDSVCVVCIDNLKRKIYITEAGGA